MKILVCGGAGYIGSHAVLELLRKGCAVTAADNLERGHRAAVNPDAKFVQGDLRDPEFAMKLLKDEKPDAVMNFAAYASVAESVAKPLMYFKNNTAGALNLLAAMEAAGCNYLVFSSTAAVYGIPEAMPIGEDCPAHPINPYGESKLAIEKALGWAAKANGPRSAVLRYFNVAGADQSGDIGEDHRPETHIIPLAINAAVNGTPFTVFGKDYNTPDGTCVRDYVHVSDLIDAHILALGRLMKPEAGTSLLYNLGGDKGYSNLEIIRAVEDVTGKKLDLRFGERRPGDPDELLANHDKIRQDLGAYPKRSLHDMIESARLFMEKHPAGYDV